MNYRIAIPWDQLLNDAPRTAYKFVAEAVVSVDEMERLGGLPNWVDKNALVATFVQAAARDFHSSTVAVALQGVSDAIREAAP